MSTLERLRELEAEYNNEAGGISSAEIREVMEALPKLLAVVDAAEEAGQIGELTKKLDDALRALES